MSFTDLGLSERVLKAVEGAGYTEATPIQAQAIPHAMQRRDVLGIAQTGTGKTAAFVLPMLSLLESGRARARMPRTLILEPTRELAAQVEDSFMKYGVQHKLNVALLIGGMSFGDQDAKITRGVDVLIATPGRLLDHVERGKLLLTGIEILVIDEADRMLDMGFIPDIERICKLVPFTRQTLFFSATMPPEITRLTEAFLHNPVRVEVSRPASTVNTITQRLVASGGKDYEKREVLRDLIKNAENLQNAIIFCNRKKEVGVLHRSLVKYGFKAVALHGDMDQHARLAALDSFKNGDMEFLVASDVAARGLDIPAVSHVFNYDTPHHAEDYVHRIGRTGRAGRPGASITLVTSSDDKSLAAIEKLIGQKIEWSGAPTPAGGGRGERRDGERGRGRGDHGRGDSGRGDSGRGERRPPRRREEFGGETRADAGGRDHARAERAAEPREPAAEASPRSQDHTPRPDRSPRRAPAGPREPVAPREQARPPRYAEEREPRRYERDAGDERVVGLGDHVPSFLLRPVRPAAQG